MLSGNSAELESASGILNLRWEETGGRILIWVLISAEQGLPVFGQPMTGTAERAEIARALGITESALLPEAPQSVSTSRPKLMIGIRTPDILDHIAPRFEDLWTLCDRYAVSGFYPYTFMPDGTTIRARQFPNRSGYPEDPATGVAAGSLCCYLIHTGQVPCVEGRNHFLILQDQAMGRPSRLGADIIVTAGRISGTSVCGSAVFTDGPEEALT